MLKNGPAHAMVTTGADNLKRFKTGAGALEEGAPSKGRHHSSAAHLSSWAESLMRNLERCCCSTAST